MSATPFFLNGSGYLPGKLFTWVVSDFSLMDAIECGIVKIPRVPVEDATTKSDNKLPINRNIFRHVRDKLPKGNHQQSLDPEELPVPLLGALESLYEDYKKTAKAWEDAGIEEPPVFIVVCNNTSTSKLVYEWIGGYERNGQWAQGALKRFSNVDENDKPYKYSPTFLIDSKRLESGEALTSEFKKIAAGEIEQFKHEMRVRNPGKDVSKITDEEILREAMNTVGKKGKLGAGIRCVVSVSMLTEGWDANTVTHVCGVRAFGTQLLCEQVVGRALRRLHYDVDEKGMLSPEYANVYGVPFVFAKPGISTIEPPKKKTRIRHLDERARLAIRFPRIRGYKIKPPEERLTAKFDTNSRKILNAKHAAPITQMEGIIGEGEKLTLDDIKKHRYNEVVYSLAALTARHFTDKGDVAPSRFRDLVPIVDRWLKECVKCEEGTFVQYFLWRTLAEEAAQQISMACRRETDDKKIYQPIPDPFTPEGSTDNVDFLTSQKLLHESLPDKSHVNIAVCDSSWEKDFCEILEDVPNVYSYARNAGLGFSVPYTINGKKERKYFPDFIVRINDRNDLGDLLSLIVEIKGIKKEDARAKADTMNRLWVPSVNNYGCWGRWAFLEIMDMQDARKLVEKYVPQSKAA